MQISEIQISFIKPKEGLIGFASLIINNSFYLSSIGIHERRSGEGYRLTYPTKQAGDRAMNIFHPINKETSMAIENAVLDKIKEVMRKQYAGHYRVVDR